MIRCALMIGALVALGSDCAAACPGPAPSAPSTPSSVDDPRIPAVCQAARQSPPGLEIAGLDVPVEAPRAVDSAVTTIRMLSIDPLQFEVLAPASRPNDELTRLAWVGVAVTPRAAAKLVKLRFGDVVAIRYATPWRPVRDGIDTDPVVITDVERSDAPAPAAPRLADWLPADGHEITVYADGHASVVLPDERVEVTLSAAELQTFLGSFASARFDELATELPAARPGTGVIDGGEIALSCARHQRVRVAGHEAALAPVIAAFATVRARAAARESPLLYVEQRASPAYIIEWPADAPPLADLHRLQEQAEPQARAGDYSSPVFRPLSGALKEAFAASRRAPGGAVPQWLVRDHGGLRWLSVRGCAYGSPVCRPDTYDAVGVNVPGEQEAPAWAPDFSTIPTFDQGGMFFDEAKHARWRELRGWYLQGDTLYYIEQTRRVRPTP
jgi:hypothetical protein